MNIIRATSKEPRNCPVPANYFLNYPLIFMLAQHHTSLSLNFRLFYIPFVSSFPSSLFTTIFFSPQFSPRSLFPTLSCLFVSFSSSLFYVSPWGSFLAVIPPFLFFPYSPFDPPPQPAFFVISPPLLPPYPSIFEIYPPTDQPTLLPPPIIIHFTPPLSFNFVFATIPLQVTINH